MKKQELITADNRETFARRVNEAFKEGAAIVPTTMLAVCKQSNSFGNEICWVAVVEYPEK